MFRKVILQLIEFLKRFVPEIQDVDNINLVTSLVLHTAAMGLQKGQYVEFAPIKGTCGNIKLSGNSLPTFVYTVFDKSIMEFIEVRVEVSKPDRIRYLSKIISTDGSVEGKEIDTKEKYKDPFIRFSGHLYRYFPYPMGGGVIRDGKVQHAISEPNRPLESALPHVSGSA